VSVSISISLYLCPYLYFVSVSVPVSVFVSLHFVLLYLFVFHPLCSMYCYESAIYVHQIYADGGHGCEHVYVSAHMGMAVSMCMFLHADGMISSICIYGM
jgi:hypothetical protein